ncbi:MAG: glycine betaine ABC transporter substrate-binding protein [Acidobacteriota bacterium]
MRGTILFLVTALFVLPLGSCHSGDGLVIGSKSFGEQVLLGEIVAQQIERRMELRVDRRFNLTGTFILDRALRAGELDAYVEYTGTAFTAILKRDPITDPAQVYRQVREEYRKSGLEWLRPLGFNNTFAILIRAEVAHRLGLKTISQAAAHASGWKPGFGYEFIERKDGFQGLAKTYGLKFAQPPRVMELGLVYRALADGQIDLAAGNSTSGLISALDLAVLEDDKEYFPPYQAAIVIRQATLDRYPRLKSVLEQLSGAFSDQEMRRLNYEVDGKQRPVAAVARGFLSGLKDLSGEKGREK